MTQVLESVKLQPKQNFKLLCEALETSGTEGIKDIVTELKRESAINNMISLCITIYV